MKVYTSLVRPLLEYSAQLWHAGLATTQSDLLESIQERALSIAYPDQALEYTSLPSLKSRRDELCKRLFQDCKKPDHKLHPLLPETRSMIHGLHSAYPYKLPLVKTDRFKDCFMNYCLFNKY